MRTYTIYDLGMNVDGEKFILPISYQLNSDIDGDQDILKRTLELFTPYLNVDKKKNIEIDKKWDNIQIPCLYEGYDGYYPYEIVLKVFCLKYDDEKRLYKEDKTDERIAFAHRRSESYEVQNGQLMVALSVQAAEELLNELIDIKVLPNVIEKVGLKRYNYWL